MDFKVGRRAQAKAGLVDAMLHIVRHGLGRIGEYGGLVHVVPESGYIVRDEILL
jgi:hypothetical protein